MKKFYWGTVYAEFTDKNGKYVSVWKEDEIDGFCVSSEEIKSECNFSGGCAWCNESETLSGAFEVFSKIIKNAEENDGVINSKWVVETFGKCSC